MLNKAEPHRMPLVTWLKVDADNTIQLMNPLKSLPSGRHFSQGHYVNFIKYYTQIQLPQRA